MNKFESNLYIEIMRESYLRINNIQNKLTKKLIRNIKKDIIKKRKENENGR